jgi:hypothetical protein
MQTMVQPFIIILIYFLRSAICASPENSFPVHYASWFTTYSTPNEFVANTYNFSAFNWSQLLYPSTTDDNPYERVNLPFSFPLLGVDQFITYVGANGNLLFDTTKIPPCNAFCVPVFQSYYGSINGLCSDWNPSQADVSYVAYLSNHTDIFFRFFDMEYYGFSFSKNTFHIQLSSDGGVRVYYDSITLPSQISTLYPAEAKFFPPYILPVRDGIISGIREYSSSPQYYSMSVGQRTDMISWNQTKINGIYPNLNLVQSNSVWKACPISDLWCLNVKTYNLSSTANTVTGFNASLSTISPISCQNEFIGYDCTIRFSNTTSSNIITTVPALMLSDTSFLCTFTPALLIQAYNALSSSGTDSITAFIGLRADISTTSYLPGDTSSLVSYVDLLTTSIPLLFVNAVQNPSLASSGCATTPAVSANASYCDACDICSQSFTCLYNQSFCPALEDPYARPNCAGNCSFPNSLDEKGLLLPDSKNKCCLASTIDCEGNCGGGKMVGYAVNTGILDGQAIFAVQSICCDGKVDCKGVCNGNTFNDCAGVCGGSATYDDCGTCSGMICLN